MHAMRFCCGAFRTSPRAALQVKMGEMPLAEKTQTTENGMVPLWSLHYNEHPTKAIFSKCWEHGKSNDKNIGNETSKTVQISVILPWMYNALF